jgi:hypothetical protein
METEQRIPIDGEPQLPRYSEPGVDLPRVIANVVLIPLGILFTFGAVPRIAFVDRMTQSLLAPGAFTFVIWALIFASQCVYAFYQAQPQHHRDPVLRRIGWHTALNGLLIGCWSLAFAYAYIPLAWVLLIVMVANLAVVEVELGDDARHGSRLWLVRSPFVTNLAWISFALVVQTSTMLTTAIGYLPSRAAAIAWSLTLVILTASYGAAMALWRRHGAYAFAIAWGLFGIGAYRFGTSHALGITAYTFAAILVAIGLAQIVATTRGFSLHRVRHA